MALIKCPQCGAMISDRAKQCPKCGWIPKIPSKKETAESAPQPTTQGETSQKPFKGKMVIIAVGIVALIAVVMVMLSTGKSENSENSESVVLPQEEPITINVDSIYASLVTPDIAFCDLHGYVKSMVLEYEDIQDGMDSEPITMKSMMFDENGYWKPIPNWSKADLEELKYDNTFNANSTPKLVKDDKGYVKIEREYYPISGIVLFEYVWDDGRIIRKYSPEDQSLEDTKYQYDNNGLLIKTITTSINYEGDESSNEDIKSYSDYKFDEYGNWTQRLVNKAYIVKYAYNNMVDTTNTVYIERRNISYYPKDVVTHATINKANETPQNDNVPEVESPEDVPMPAPEEPIAPISQ